MKRDGLDFEARGHTKWDIGKYEAGECPFSSSQCRSDPRHFADPLATLQGLATVGVAGVSNDESNLFVKLKKEHISSQGRKVG